MVRISDVDVVSYTLPSVGLCFALAFLAFFLLFFFNTVSGFGKVTLQDCHSERCGAGGNPGAPAQGGFILWVFLFLPQQLTDDASIGDFVLVALKDLQEVGVSEYPAWFAACEEGQLIDTRGSCPGSQVCLQPLSMARLCPLGL